MNRIFLGLVTGLMVVTTLGMGPVEARELFETSATTPYPPGCMSNRFDDLTTPTGSRQTYADDLVTFADAKDPSLSASVNVTVFRRGCKDPDRSVLFMQFEMVTANRSFAIPTVEAELSGGPYPLRLVSEPNTFETDETGRIQGPGTYLYIVDGMAEARVNSNSRLITPTQYSGPLTLRFTDPSDSNNSYTVNMPTWNTNIAPVRVPITGRHSGAWVADGAIDQGFVVSFNEWLVGDDIRQFLFFSWYTFDVDGNTLWLTAGNAYDRGASEVDLELELVSGGTFLGDDTANRVKVGTATLRAESCSEMTLTYDLTDLGLGSGTVTLRRIFALETAGYACMDLEARLDSL